MTYKVYQFALTGDLFLMKTGKIKSNIICSEYVEGFVKFNFELFLVYSYCLGEL